MEPNGDGSFEEKIKKNYQGILVIKNLASDFPSVPRFVSEYLIMGTVNKNGEISDENLIKIHDFIKNYRPDPKNYQVWKDKFIETNENKLLDIFNVQVDLSVSPPLRRCYVPFLQKESPIKIEDEIVENNPNLLREGIWGLGTIKQDAVKFGSFKTALVLNEFKPFELTHFSLNQYLNGFKNFNREEWIDLLINSIGLNPDFYDNLDQKLLLLCRLIPIVETNTNMIELGPKETGKSYLMENISPNVYNVQPSDVTMANLFYNATTKQIGLLGLKDTLIFDEIGDVPLKADSKKIPPKLRGYLSDGKFKKGDKEIYSKCSIVLMGNIKCNENLVPQTTKYIFAIEKAWRDSAMLDRFAGLIFGWELKKLTVTAYSQSYGFAGDYFHRVLSTLRDLPFRIKIEKRVDLRNGGEKASPRNHKAIFSITSGLLKLITPNENYSKEDLEMTLDLAIKLRTQLYDQLKYLDDEYKKEINLNYNFR